MDIDNDDEDDYFATTAPTQALLNASEETQAEVRCQKLSYDVLCVCSFYK